MTDYVLAVGAKTAPAARAPEHMAGWLDDHGYRLVRVPADIEPGDPYDADLADRIASLIARQSCCRDGADRCSILRQVLAAGQPAPTYAGWRDVPATRRTSIVAATPHLPDLDRRICSMTDLCWSRT